MAEITITEDNMAEASANVAIEWLEDDADGNPSIVLIVPVIAAKLWHELVNMKGAGNDKGKAD